MTATNLFEDDLLDLIFTNVAAPNVGDAPGLLPSATPASFFISLHTDAGAVDDTDTLQTSNEAAYSGPYARIGVVRSTGGWSVSGGNVDNDAAITYIQCDGGSEVEDQFGIGFAASGAGVLQIFGALSSSLTVSNGIQPEFAAQALDIALD